MKTITRFFSNPRRCALALLLSTISYQLSTSPALAQGTAFTYQGRLNATNGVANGSYDFAFAVFDTGSGGVSGSGAITNAAVAVSNGLFTTTLDFGNAPDGLPAWLEIAVRTNSTAGVFTTLSPRQRILPTPYAMFATTASNVAGNVALAQLPVTVLTNGAGGVNLTGTFTGNGANMTNVNAATLGGLTAGTFWRLNGNSVAPGQFLGSTNSQPLEFKVNGRRALRIEDNGDSSDPHDSDSIPDGAPNMIGGSSGNFVGAGVVGATIAGGGATNYGGATIFTNVVLADFGVISGGAQNLIQANAGSAIIGGGDRNTIGADAGRSFIGGGQFNGIRSNAQSSVISGGAFNAVGTNGLAASISGGAFNQVGNDSYGSSIGGGYNNTNANNSPYSHIGGGYLNTIADNSAYGVIGGGSNNLVVANSYQATIGGGGQNSIGTNSSGSTIAGGQNNVISNNAIYSTIGGGLVNAASGLASTVGGGARNIASGRSATVSGGGDTANVFSPGNYATGDYSTVGGGLGNRATNYYSTVSGGQGNVASGFWAIVAGGFQNSATDGFATVPGGDYNLAGGQHSFAAGHRAKAIHTGAFVWADSQEADFASTAANQFLVRAAGGVGINTSNPVVSLTVQGSGAYNSIAAAAIAVRNTTANKTWEWHVLDDGRMQFADLGAGATRMVIDTAGNVSALAFNPTSDRHAKENFATVSAQEILAKVAALPITRWNFKQETGTPHIGPMAQDFRAAFGTGLDDRHIATVDADGVALAAIQGLNEKVEVRSQKSEVRVQKLEAENAELKLRLEKLERRLDSKNEDSK